MAERKYKIYEKVSVWNEVTSFDKEGDYTWGPTDAIETEYYEIVKNTAYEEKVETFLTFDGIKRFISKHDDISLYEELIK